MPARSTSIPIKRTKLYRPPCTPDFVCRDELHSRLTSALQGPLTLVSAPAGYGKSTLVSHWLERFDGKAAWISLEADDAELRTFLRSLVIALSDAFPRACVELPPYLAARDLPPLDTLITACSNDLERIKRPCIVALDDYHAIPVKSPVHELVAALVEHPARHVHIAVLARRHPPLPLARLRSRGSVVEFGIRELAFDRADSESLLSGMVPWKLAGQLVDRIHDMTEGWPVALRMAGMALLRLGGASDALRTDFDGDTKELQEYLLTEILAGLSTAARDCLCQTSILDRFSGPLSRSLCESQCASKDCIHNQSGSARSYEAAGVLCIDLDAKGEWHRFHHLLQKALQERLLRDRGPEVVAGLHRRAAAWFEAEGLIEDAVRHAVKAGGDGDVAAIIARNRQALMNTGQWVRLRHWLELVPPEVAACDPRLLIVQGWFHVGYPEMFEILDRVEERLGRGEDDEDARHLRGELLSLQALMPYVVADGAETVRMSREALQLLAEDQLAQRGFSTLLLVLGEQMKGHHAEARHELLKALAQAGPRQGIYFGRVLIAGCLFCWLDADLNGLADYARQCRDLGVANDFPEILAHGHYFMGICAYARDDLAAAVMHLESVVLDPAIANSHNWIHSLYALASCYRALGRTPDAVDLLDRVMPHALGHGNASMVDQSQAFRAEMALRQGHRAEAVAWAGGYRETAPRTMYRFYEPAFTRVRVMLAQGDTAGLKRAARLIGELGDFTARTHNRLFTIKTQILSAQLLLKQDQQKQALAAVGEAVKLAQPGGCLRFFVDDGEPLIPLLSQLDLDAEGLSFVGRILAAMRTAVSAPTGASSAPTTGHPPPVHAGPQPLLDPLSARELEVLPLLAGRLTNKEIAAKLFISPVTVKRHTSNIYSKLGVHGRRDAVAKAEGLGLLA